MAEISFADVTKRFDDGTVAVDAVTMDVEDGEFMVLVGPSGSGKTTMMRMVAGLEEMSDGTIRIGEQVVNDVPARSRNVAMVFQNYALYPHMTVGKNIGFPLRLAKVPKAEAQTLVQNAADMLGIGDLLERKPRQLSGGQRQRVAMGRAIVRQPAAFLMDEPLSNLDAKLRVEMRAYIARLHQELKTTTLYVTHDQSEAMTMGDRVALMRDGRIEQLDRPNALYERPRNLFVAGFIGSPGMNIVRGKYSGGSVRAGGIELPLRESAPGLRAYEGRELLVGIRPEAFSDAAHEVSTEGRQLFDARISLAQSMGSEVIAHFEPVGGAVQTEDVSAFTGESDGVAGRDQLSDAHQLVGRFDPRTQAASGNVMQVSLDLDRIHFFDPESEQAIR